MAKALLGHLGAVDPRLLEEVRRLQRRVHDLEAEVARLQIENEALAEAVAQTHVSEDDLLSLADHSLQDHAVAR